MGSLWMRFSFSLSLSVYVCLRIYGVYVVHTQQAFPCKFPFLRSVSSFFFCFALFPSFVGNNEWLFCALLFLWLITLVWYNVTMPTIIVTTSFKECPFKVALLPAALLSLPNPFATLPWEICDRRKNHVSAICKKHIILHVTRIPNQKTPQKQKIIILHNCSLDIIKYIYQDHRTTIKLGLLRWQNSSW